MEQWTQRTSGTVDTEDQWAQRTSGHRGPVGTEDQWNIGYRGPEEQWNSGYRELVEHGVQRKDQRNSGYRGPEEVWVNVKVWASLRKNDKCDRKLKCFAISIKKRK